MPTRATSLRFTITETNNGIEPCIDELEVFATDGKNVALTAKATSSGDYAGNPKHKLSHINDGRFSNDWSWISNTAGSGWVELTFAAPVESRGSFGAAIARRSFATVCRRICDRTPRRRGPTGAPWPHRRIARGRTRRGPDHSRNWSRSGRTWRSGSPPSACRAWRTAGQFGKPEATLRFHRGDPMQPKEAIAPAGLSEFGGFHLPMDAPERDRRVALAKWIASPENPLTARVIVNRLWHYHFGTGIVDTPSDFGLNGGAVAP